MTDKFDKLADLMRKAYAEGRTVSVQLGVPKEVHQVAVKYPMAEYATHHYVKADDSRLEQASGAVVLNLDYYERMKGFEGEQRGPAAYKYEPERDELKPDSEFLIELVHIYEPAGSPAKTEK